MKNESTKRIMSVILVAMMLSTGLLTLLGTGATAQGPVASTNSTGSTDAAGNSPQPDMERSTASNDPVTEAENKQDMLMEPVYSDLSPEHIKEGGYDIPAPSSVDNYSGIGDVHEMGYNGSDVNVAVVDSGIDFGHIDLQGTQMVEPETMNSINEPVLPSATNGTEYVLLGNESVVSGTLHVYKNGVELTTGTDYTVDYSTGNITFTTPLSQGDSITATYTYNTPYGGWPVTFDPTSMKKFLSTGSPEGTMFADTSVTGSGPFERTHSINVDGYSDFYDSERRGSSDDREQAQKRYFDLTDQYATYDSDNWYFGFPLYDLPTNTWSNVTAGLMIDTDNGVTGAVNAPEGKLVSTNSSHSSSVTDVAFSPDGTMIASSSMDKTVRIWNPNTGICSLTFSKHTSTPFSLAWSPNGTMITSIDSTDIMLWNPFTGEVYRDIAYPTGPFNEGTTDFYNNMRSSFISVSPNGTWLAVGTLGGSGGVYRILIYNLTTGQEFGRIWINNNKAYTVSFDATGTDLAVGFDDNKIYVVELNATNIITAGETTTKAYSKYTLSGHTAPVLSLDWSPDNTRIASTGRDGHVIIWNNLSNDSQRTTIYPDTTVTNAYCVKWVGNSEVLFSTQTSNQPYQYFRAYAADGSTEYFNRTQDYPIYAFDVHGDRIVTAGGDTNVNLWNKTSGNYIRTMTAHRANYAIYVDYWVRWDDRENKFIKSSGNTRIYVWNTVSSTWDRKGLDEMGSNFASAELGEQLFNEISIPRSRLNTESLDMELFTCGQNISHAQDSAPDDFHILDMNHNYEKAVDDYNEPDLDWSNETTPLSNFAHVSIKYYTVSGIPSASGTYHFGYHPSPVLNKRLNGLGLLVTDSTTPGVYDKVYLDFNGDHVFDENDVNVTKEHPIATYDSNGDGYPDFSAGMIYFMGSAKEVKDELVAIGESGNTTTSFNLDHRNLVAFPEPVVKLNGNKWLDKKITETVTPDAGSTGIKLSRRFIIDSTLGATAENMTVANESAFKTRDGKVWYELSHTEQYTYHDCSLYAEIDASVLPSVPAWLSDTPASTWVKLSDTNYTLYQNGSIRLNNPTIKWPSSYYPFYAYYPLPDGTKIYAYYNFSGPLVKNSDYTFDGDTGVITLKSPLITSLNESMPTRISATYTYHPYVVDKEKGVIATSVPLNAGDSLEISYDYDGKYLPYSSVYAEKKGLTNLAVGNGDLIAFSGELREGTSGAVTQHGTRVASAIASQARNPWSNISGVAPGAKLISIMDGAKSSNVEDAWYFAANGYDGYPNTGDEANVVVNAFTYPEKTESGFDKYSRLADYISTEYTVGKLVFVGSAGSAGYGYGTIPSPAASPSMITVGGRADISLYVKSMSNTEGPYPAKNEVDQMCGKGPTLMGIPKPELVAIEMGYVDLPPQSLTSNDGNRSFTQKNQLWISPDYSASVTAGAVALLMNAYSSTHGTLPDVSTTREILISSADDLGFDSLSQGGGELNITKAIYIATGNGSAGITTTRQIWTPGGYHGEHYDGFTNMMLPGTDSSTEITLTNHGNKTRTADVTSEVYRKVGAFDYSEETSTYTYDEPIAAVLHAIGSGPTVQHTLMANSTILVMNETGLYTLNRTPEDQEPDDTTGIAGLQNYPMGKLVDGINTTLWNESWNQADMVRVTAFADFDSYSASGSDGTVFNYSFSLSLQGWDMGPQRFLDSWKAAHDHDSYWPYVNKTNCTFPTENDFQDLNESSFTRSNIYDINTIAASSGTTKMPSNVLQVETSNPREKGHDGLALFMNGDGTEDGIVWNYQIEFFNKTSWSWVSINAKSSDTIDLPAGGSANVSLKMSVPADAHMGSYEGSIKVTTPIDVNRTDITTIPVVVNVGADKGRVSFGSTAADSLMNPTSFMGGYGFNTKEIDRTGDWRYFYVDIPASGIYSDPTGKSLTIDLKWDNMPADLDVVVFKPAADDFSGENPERYGPFSVTEDVKSKVPVKYEFNTATGGPEEILATDLTTGLHVIAIRPVRMSGKAAFENISSLDLGIITHSTDLTVQTNNYYDTGSVFFSSTMPFSGLNASAVGPANSETETDIPIPQDYQSWWNFPTWPEWLVRGSYTKVVHVENALIFDVHIWGHSDSPDLDLGIFYDANGDGVAQPSEYVATCADSDADEEVKLTNPVDGDYIIKVLGFDDADPGHFDITISIILATGEGYKITGLDPSVPYTPGDVVSFGMLWNFPGNTAEKEYMGAINVGPKNAPDLILIPVSVTLDVTAPAVSETKPMYNEVVNTPDPTIMFSFSEENSINTDSARMTIDGTDHTLDCKVTDTSIIYTPTGDMADGLHIVNASIADVAGNVLTYSWMFTIDTSTTLGEPASVIEVPAASNDGFIYTNSSTYTIHGSLNAGSHLTVNGQEIEADADGSFTVTINLTAGNNIISILASDNSGRTTRRDISIVYDTTPPSFIVSPSSRLTRDSSVTLNGKIDLITESGAVKLTVNGREIPTNIDGSFNYEIALTEGENIISVTATDAAGNSATKDIRVVKDSAAPTLEIDSIPDTVSTRQITVSGTAEPGSKVYVNGKQVITTNGAFSTDVSLATGSNIITVSAVDSAGNRADYSLSVVYQPSEELAAAAITTTAQTAPTLSSTAGILLVVVAIIFLIIGFVASRFMKRGGGETGAEAVEPLQETPVEEETEIGAEEPEEEVFEGSEISPEESDVVPEQIEEEYEEAEEPEMEEEPEDISDEIMEGSVESDVVPEQIGEEYEEPLFDLNAAISDGNELLAAGENIRALEIFEKVIENAPDKVEGYLGKARALDATGKWGQALQMVNKAQEIDPQSVEALELKGDIFAGQNKTEMARSAYTQALEIEPGNTDIRNKLSALD